MDAFDCAGTSEVDCVGRDDGITGVGLHVDGQGEVEVFEVGQTRQCETVDHIQGISREDIAATTSGPAAPHGAVDRATEKVDRVVRRRAGIEEMLASLPAEWCNIDILVNNAGLALGMEPAHKASIEDWETMIDTNNKGLVYMTRAVLPGMVERNHGHIINIGSTAGSWPYAGGNVYGATKAFVRQFSLNLRTDLHGTAVRVTDIEPGLVGGTEFSNVRFKGDDGKAEKTYQNTVALTPEDVSEAVWWVSTLPAHVNINTLEMMPVTQSYAGLNVHRQ